MLAKLEIARILIVNNGLILFTLENQLTHTKYNMPERPRIDI
jgi:hypothetical protein